MLAELLRKLPQYLLTRYLALTTTCSVLLHACQVSEEQLSGSEAGKAEWKDTVEHIRSTFVFKERKKSPNTLM